MRITYTHSLAIFLRIYPALQVSDNVDGIKQLPKPQILAGTVVPQSLDTLTIGQLFELQDMTKETLFAPATIILGTSKDKLLSCPAISVLGFNGWVAKEMLRIARMFEDIPSELTIEERRAGADKLNFGCFGIIDHYALRMGIADHDYILQCVPWITVWQVMMNDAKKALYERRLRKILLKEK